MLARPDLTPRRGKQQPLQLGGQGRRAGRGQRVGADTDLGQSGAGKRAVGVGRQSVAAVQNDRDAVLHALIGVAVSAYFPDLTLTGNYGAAGDDIGRLFSASTTVWSLGAEATETLLDFGARGAQVAAARAAYDEDVAIYRETVLTALQGVEDELAALRIYQRQQTVAIEAEQVAQQNVKLDIDEYREGTIDYTTVITAQNNLQTASLSVLTVLESRLGASVLLIENIGGGWAATDLPKS